jgi:hypothetical protein
MLRRLLIITLCVLSLPAFSSLLPRNGRNPAPYAVTVFAGHNNMGGSCTCGCPGCACDPGETPANCTESSRVAIPPDHTTPKHKTPTSDYGTGMLALAVAFFIWLRFRTT